ALKEVRAGLGRLRARCTAFLALYPNVDAFCRSAHMDDQQPGSALQGLWDEIPKLAREIEEALGDEPTPNALPEEIRAACEELLGSVRLTGGAPLDPGFEQKLNSIVEYCQRELLPGLAEPFLVKTRDVLEADAAEGRRLMHHIRDFVI